MSKGGASLRCVLCVLWSIAPSRDGYVKGKWKVESSPGPETRRNEHFVLDTRYKGWRLGLSLGLGLVLGLVFEVEGTRGTGKKQKGERRKEQEAVVAVSNAMDAMENDGG